MAIEEGADALGFVLEPTSPRCLAGPMDWIGELPGVPLRVAVFGKVDRALPKGLFDRVQGVDWDLLFEPPARRLHVVRLRPGSAIGDYLHLTINASTVVLDAFSEIAYGGTGKTVDWGLAAEFVAACSKPVFLAGGLTPDNVAQAVQRVRPYGVDVSSGVERLPGEKDHVLLKRFIRNTRAAREQ